MMYHVVMTSRLGKTDIHIDICRYTCALVRMYAWTCVCVYMCVCTHISLTVSDAY